MNLLFCSALILINYFSEIYSSPNKSDALKTVVDLRGQFPYQTNGTNYRIATMPPFTKLLLEFDFKVRTVQKGFIRTHILCFESRSMRLTLYLDGWGQFGIFHYDEQLDYFSQDKPLLIVNLVTLPISATRDFNHFALAIQDNHRVSLQIDGHQFYKQIDRKMCPQDETVNVWMDMQEFRAGGAIKNLVIFEL